MTPDRGALTPVEQYGAKVWIKRDDLFELNGSCGGKVRTCLALAQRAGTKGLVTAGSRHSPQVNIVATVAAHLGLPARCHVPAGPDTPELAAARALGADIRTWRPGHNSVIKARARVDAEANGWRHIPFGMEDHEACRQTAAQAANVPAEVQRLVVPVGSGMSLAGILHGLDVLEHRASVLGVVVGASPVKRLDRYAPPFWRERVTLVPAGVPYHEYAANTQLGGVHLDPVYEGKCVPFLRRGDLLWVVGVRATAKNGGNP